MLKIPPSSRTQEASDTPFDNSTNGFTATDVQAAIEEAKNSALGRARFTASCGFDGTASAGRYLEYQSNVDSNLSGFVIPRACHFWEMAFAIVSNGAVTFTVYTWDGTTETAIATVRTTAAQRKASVVNLNIALPAMTELRVKCTAGSGARPVVFQWFIFD